MSYLAFAEPERRRLILQIAAEGGGVSNDVLLRSGLRYWGVVSSLAEVHRSIDWLVERGLLGAEELTGDAGPRRRVMLTSRGRDAAQGGADVEGVAPRVRQE